MSKHLTPLNIVFCGHVDAGKSTITGHLLVLEGQVDDRTLEKTFRDAEATKMDSWKYAFVMDTSEEERVKGKTVECARAAFSTDNRKFMLIDAPGHNGYVPAMIAGATQADVAVLVISARGSEFEAGFSRGGQTREHALICRTAGVRKIVVAINKMDDPTVNWSQARYDSIVNEVTPFLKGTGYNPAKDVVFLPISGFTGAGLMERIPTDVCSWYNGPCLTEVLDTIPLPPLDTEAPLRMPIIDRFKDSGALQLMGKIETGKISIGDKLFMNPQNAKVEVLGITQEGEELTEALAGENVFVSVKGVNEEEVHSGDVLTAESSKMTAVDTFVATLIILEHKNIITEGYKAIMHCHSIQTSITIDCLLAELDKKTRKIKTKMPKYATAGQMVAVRIKLDDKCCVATQELDGKMSRFILRDENKTIGVGVITKLK